MPIYEFFCEECNMVFNFFSSRIDTEKRPNCPKCGKENLEKWLSTFATIGKASEDEEDPLLGMDESKMERAFESLMKEAENVNEDDPRQMASLMRRFTDQTGIRLGESMEEAISRMEAGEDPEVVEREMGDLIEQEDFTIDGLKKKVASMKKTPIHDETLYEL